ncbi:lysozyme inhibitor LprI family protein [Pseudovibrio sp. Alg231-02]|uniref:lysozyme inhibitor LprI family protein n=1 Tax=Pseudovibrio sp. Alg231-02 TaxID=1922223 RepID=UPI000D55B215|nr:lysozyme inhibitor LprI family protein [Pseudovibrio sp. Alg231-02]
MSFMRTSLFSLSLVLSLCSLAQAADEPTEEQAATIAKCVEEKGGGYPAMACFGEVMEQCIGSQYQNSHMIFCAVQEYMVWDQRFNTAYAEIMKVASTNVKASLKNAQRNWIKFRDDTCSANALIYEGGSNASLAMSVCMGDQTAVRSLQLQQFLVEAGPH